MQANITRLKNETNSKYKVNCLMRFPLGMNKQFVKQTSFFKYKGNN